MIIRCDYDAPIGCPCCGIEIDKKKSITTSIEEHEKKCDYDEDHTHLMKIYLVKGEIDAFVLEEWLSKYDEDDYELHFKDPLKT